MSEVWKDIEGFPGYQVSNMGRVRTHNKITYTTRHGARHWKDRILKQKVRKDRCCQVNLWLNGKATTQYVHRLVAEAFIGKPADNMTVNHKDGDRGNNTVANLEWLTLTDNIRHGFETGLFSTQRKCVLVNKSGKKYEFRSQCEASRFLGRSDGYIMGVIKRNRKITDINGNEYQLLGDKP